MFGSGQCRAPTLCLVVFFCAAGEVFVTGGTCSAQTLFLCDPHLMLDSYRTIVDADHVGFCKDENLVGYGRLSNDETR
jgi:hypothetical protein